MTFDEFEALVGQGEYVRCRDKRPVYRGTATQYLARSHLLGGGQLGWVIKPGFMVVDIDGDKSQIIEVIANLGIKTLTAETPNGIHLYFRCNDKTPVKSRHTTLSCGLVGDIVHADGSYVILPFGQKDRQFNSCGHIAEYPEGGV